MKFDNEQKRAINHLNGPLLLIAGPGSGKTTTMTERVANMICNHNINADRILVITFSKASSVEMKNRFVKRMQPLNYDVTFGTFHSVFLSMIKKFFGNKVNLNVIDDSVKKEYIEETLHKIGYEYVSSDFLEEFLLDLTLFKNSDNDLSAYLPVSCDFSMFSRIYSGYENLMLKNENIDFDDVISLTNNLLLYNKDFREYWQSKYDYILIDEFQDINELQFSAVLKLAEKHNNLFAVGDEDQSIYGFRGSKPEIMVNFKKVFNDSKILYLCNNYRSGSKIVSAASELIKHNKKRYNKDFKAHNCISGEVNVFKFYDFDEQITAIATALKNIEKQSFAVLCRTNADKIYCIKKLKQFSDKIKILTMHECKGLEFDYVWIINAMDGICPFRHSLYDSDIEEERRLFYVAVTRAKMCLNISYCTARKGIKRKKSPFIKELKIKRHLHT